MNRVMFPSFSTEMTKKYMFFGFYLKKDRVCGLPSGYYITIYDAFLLADFRSGQVRYVCPQSLFALFSVLSVFYDKEIPYWLIAGEDMAEGKSLTAIKHTPPRSVSFLINIRVLSHIPLATVLVMAKIRTESRKRKRKSIS
jgi:hypothetical protein